MKKYYFILVLFTLFTGLVAAADYSFEIPEFVCNVSINQDRSLLIYYEITFKCSPGAHPIDIVDIGFPSRDYDLSRIRAEINGHVLDDIKASSAIPIGVEVPLGSYAIAPDSTGVFKFSGVNTNMVFKDTSQEEFASVEFTPTWFDSSLLVGTSHFKLQLQFPPGAKPDSVRYHQKKFTDSFVTEEGRVIYVWEEPHRADSAYMVGVSFPAELIQGELPNSPPPVTAAQESSSSASPLSAFFSCLPSMICPGIFIGFFVLAIINAFRRKHKYLPPTIGVEGVGIKRGLTAPMAALLLEEKLEKVLALVLYGLIRKGAVKTESIQGRTTFTKQTIDESKEWDYEKDFLKAIDKSGDLDKDALRDTFTNMIKDLNTRMKGFSLKETRQYYRSIVDKAWQMVSDAGVSGDTIGIVEEQLPWMMMAGDFNQRIRTVPVFVFAFPQDHWLHSYTSGAAGSPGSFNIQQICNQVASSMENFAHSVVGGGGSLAEAVTAVTNPIPKSSGGGGHSGGCACACACAGCACACAGGGR